MTVKQENLFFLLVLFLSQLCVSSSCIRADSRCDVCVDSCCCCLKIRSRVRSKTDPHESNTHKERVKISESSKKVC